MTFVLRPMLASKAPEKINFPVYASPKVDGIRAVISDGMLLSRTLKPIPNDCTQGLFGHAMYNGLDGELAVGNPTHTHLMQITTSGVMSEQGTPDVTFWVFDIWQAPGVYSERLHELRKWVASQQQDIRIKLLKQEWIETQEKLDDFEHAMLMLGFEGVMLRDPNSPYKFGRSTQKQGYLLKLKRFETDEGIVVGAEEQMHNANAATQDERGFTKRSGHQANLVPAGVMGTLVLRDNKGGAVRIGTGFTAAQRKDIWLNPNQYLGRTVTYRHFAKTGVKDAPRIPSFVAFRDPRDL